MRTAIPFLTQFKNYRMKALRGDVRGGMTAALVGIPTELIFGVIATAPLGVAYQMTGVTAGFTASIVAAVASALCGLHLGQIPGSRPTLALICAALLSDLMGHWAGWFGVAPDPAQLMSILFATAVLSGLLQIGFGVFRLGNLMKYLPAPVLSGIANGVAVLMAIQVIKPLLGVPRSMPWSDPSALWQASLFLSVAIGILTAYLYVNPLKRFAKLPSIFVALGAGVVAYYGLAFFVTPDHLGPIVGTIPAVLPEFVGTQFVSSPWTSHRIEIFSLVLPYALTIATLASIESLLCAATVDTLCQTRHRSNRELVAQGIGNVASGFFGGTPVAAAMPRVIVNVAGGAGSSLAAIVFAATLLALLLLIPGWIAAIPQVATAGILLGISWQMIDPWSRKTVRTMLFGRREMSSNLWRSLAANGMVMLVVAAATLVFGLVWALAFGVLLTTVFFLRSNQKAVIRSFSTGLEKRSMRMRPTEQSRFLDVLGGDIIIIEAQGPLFFGSADKLGSEIDARKAQAEIIVLDLTRVSYMDATAARVLQRVATGLNRSHKKFYLSGLNLEDESRGEIVLMLTDAGLSPSQWFCDLDTALEAVEDELLAIRFDPQDRWREHKLAETALGEGLSDRESELLKSYLGERRFNPQDIIFRANEPGESLFVLIKGTVSLYLNVSTLRDMRLTAFSAGTLFGAESLLENKPHTNTAVADVEVITLELTTLELERLAKEHPELAAKIYRNLGTALAERLSHAMDSLRAAVSN